ncbi:MAG: hypothetical protein QGG53_28575 [Planctomycetota bacterium]|nr:hypothetical protein [Planctomycetota bacterium]
MNPLCRIPTSVWVGLGAFILGCAIYRSEVSRLWLETAIGKTKEVPFVELGPRENEFVIRGFERGEDAFYLQAGAEGQCLLRMRVDRPVPIAIEPVFYNISGSERFSNRFSYSLEDGKAGTWKTAWQNRSYLRSQTVLIPPAKGESIVLRFEAKNTTSRRVLVLQGIRYRPVERTDIVPKLSRVLFATGIVLLLFQCIDGARKKSLYWRKLDVALLILIVALGLHLREQKFQEYVGSPLTNDAVGYQEIAREMRLFSWDHGFCAPRWREPVFPLVCAVFSTVFRDTDFHQRLLTAFAGALAIGLTWWVGREAIHPVCGLAAALLMATHDYLIFRSMYGYRLEVRTSVMLVFVYFLFVRGWHGTGDTEHAESENSDEKPPAALRSPFFWQSAIAGAAGALLILTEMSTLPMVGLFLLWHLLNHKKRWREAVPAIAACAIVLLPFLARQIATNGDPFFPLSKHATWYRNVEARRHAGEPGYPAKSEIPNYQGYAGPPIGMFGYLFSYHSIGELITGGVKGYARYLTGEPFFRQWALRGLFIAGLLALLICAGRRELAFLVLLTNSPPALSLYGMAVLIDERVMLHAMPYAAMCVSIPFLMAARALSDRMNIEQSSAPHLLNNAGPGS